MEFRDLRRKTVRSYAGGPTHVLKWGMWYKSSIKFHLTFFLKYIPRWVMCCFCLHDSRHSPSHTNLVQTKEWITILVAKQVKGSWQCQLPQVHCHAAATWMVSKNPNSASTTLIKVPFSSVWLYFSFQILPGWSKLTVFSHSSIYLPPINQFIVTGFLSSYYAQLGVVCILCEIQMASFRDTRLCPMLFS